MKSNVNCVLNKFNLLSLKDETSESGSAPKTPQDVNSLSSMPLTVQLSTLETPPSGIITEELVDHPLSPTQEQVSDTIVGNFTFDFNSIS